MGRTFLALAGALGFTGVALGAFGAHALKSRMAEVQDGAQRLEWWHTGTTYQVWHALFLFALALLAKDVAASRLLSTSGWLAVAGVVLFSGSLYVMTLTGIRVLGAVTPLGGLCFLTAWALVVVYALRRQEAR